MRSDVLASLRRLTDGELVARVKDLAARERGATALLVAHLAELDTRDVHLREGHSSLFAYCRDALGLSEHEAYNRIEAARAARRFPVILDMLEQGAVHLTTVRLLAPHLTARNHRGVLESARGKRKAEVEEIVARLAPRPDAPSSIRRLPTPVSPPANAVGALANPGAAPVPGAASSPLAVTPAADAPEAASPPPPATASLPASPIAPTAAQAAPAPSQPPARSAALTPLSPERYKLQVTIPGATLEKLRRAQDLLRHAIPSGDEAAVLDRALAALLRELARRKHAATERPRASRGRPGITPRPGRGQAHGLAAGPRPLRVRGNERAPLLGARLPGVPSRAAVRGGRGGHGREHPASLPPPQRPRGEGLLRAAP